jgi:hypothetical protein
MKQKSGPGKVPAERVLKDIRRQTSAYRISNPGILMVQSAQNRTTENASGCLGGA